MALIFFSGFGIQSNRQSFMIPVDAQIWTEADVRRDGFSLETVLGEINNRGAGVKIALIDASRRNPYERRFRSFSAGLAPVIAPNGTLVMYSAALSSVMSDNGGDHSLFVQELLKEIRVPDLMAEETLNRDPRRRDPRLAQRAGAVDFVVAGGRLLVHSGRAARDRRAPATAGCRKLRPTDHPRRAVDPPAPPKAETPASPPPEKPAMASRSKQRPAASTAPAFAGR